jgi:hypothetical protein
VGASTRRASSPSRGGSGGSGTRRPAPRPPARRGWAPFLAAHLAAVAVVAVVDSAVWAAVRPLVDGTVQPWTRVFAYTLLINVTLVRRRRPRAPRRRTSRPTRGSASARRRRWRAPPRRCAGGSDEARLRALESQLQPHFLYNTLNLVAELVHHEPEVADEMLTHLGALLRRSFRDTRTSCRWTRRWRSCARTPRSSRGATAGG